jgi:DNA invertase Pin-like site-specific DNA recombinase
MPLATGTRRSRTSARRSTKSQNAPGWQVVEIYADEISGTKGRERRPAFDRMVKAGTRHKFEMIAAWSVDRLGRSL